MTRGLPGQLYSGNAWFVEELYERYLQEPQSVTDTWRAFFDSLQDSGGSRDVAHSPIRRNYRNLQNRHNGHQAPATAKILDQGKRTAVMELINSYRFRGHNRTDLDPLHQRERPPVPELELETHHLSASDLQRRFRTDTLFAQEECSLQEILDIISDTYCATFGIEYMYINATEQKLWLQERIEKTHRRSSSFDARQKRHILKRLIAANTLEEYLHTRYVGQKRFSLEGGESLIPLLDTLVQQGGGRHIEEIVIGMAHRGRINVLVNIIGKKPSELFAEFEGKSHSDLLSSGDVKYHMGYSSDIGTPGSSVHLTLAFNPSHLEIIDPVVEGSVRARQDRRMDHDRNQVLPILIHGDAAFAGQGVVMETLNLSQTRGYSTGGTIHIIVNNQIGFTTSDPLDSRSTLYCTDVAKMVQAPILHVNGDDPEATVYAATLALEFRMAFKKDVVIDMVCFRKHGHSEADEPIATQPVMYHKIRQHPGVRAKYTQQLLAEGIVTEDDCRAVEKDYIASLEDNRSVAGTHVEHGNPKYLIDFSRFKSTHWTEAADTRLSEAEVDTLTQGITTLPQDFILHPAVSRIVKGRVQMGQGKIDMDWGYAETMAYASLLNSGVPVRVSGQDSGRGTFFHRHAVFHHQETGETYLPLQHLSPGQAPFLVINSTLSEEAVLAFDYGYSSASPDTLVVWEAQFGDFANGAQVVFDQFLSSSETKWGRYCGLVVLLPHGFDGQGPEHSSARLERYLQLCAEENMQVCMPSTPAQMFHLLRRQMLRPYRKPLIVMSPKSLLRRKLSMSPVSELSHGHFHTVIDEVEPLDKNRVVRLLTCSGKVYYDLLEARRKRGMNNVAIVRIEQLFPFPRDELRALIDAYRNLREILWVQEEPKNQGSWYYMQSRGTMLGCLRGNHTFGYAGRFYSASPAAGYMSIHLKQQQELVEHALDLDRIEETSRHHKNA